MGALTAILHRSAGQLVDRMRGEVVEARATEARMVGEAWRDHVALPANYWHDRWRAEQKLRSAERFLEALEERP
jgi:hypothetical protein